MSKVWRQTFGVWPEDRERDERYQRLMQARRRAAAPMGHVLAGRGTETADPSLVSLP